MTTRFDFGHIESEIFIDPIIKVIAVEIDEIQTVILDLVGRAF